MPLVSTGRIDAEEVNRALAQTPLGGHVLHFAKVESTQTLALNAARAGLSCGVWVADAQTAGRGRGGHTWHSSPGDGLYVTALFTPHVPATTSGLSLLAGLAAWKAIRDTAGMLVDIRWPNDLVTRPGVHPRARKLGGVLVESAVAGETLRYVVIGIGLNVGHAVFPPELQELATSLRLEGWQQPDRQELLIALLLNLQTAVHELELAEKGLSPKPDATAALVEASTWLLGKRVYVPEDGGYTGVTDGLDANGFLQVLRDGKRMTVRSGGVREA